MSKFRIFHRTWWRPDPSWPKGLEPAAGKKQFIAWAETETEARAICADWAQNHKPGRLSDKPEFEECRK